MRIQRAFSSLFFRIQRALFSPFKRSKKATGYQNVFQNSSGTSENSWCSLPIPTMKKGHWVPTCVAKCIGLFSELTALFSEFIGGFPHHSNDKESPTGDEMCLESIALLRIHRALLRIHSALLRFYTALFRIHRALSHHSNGKERPTGAKNIRPSGPKLMAGPT